MDIYENGVCTEHADSVGPIGIPGPYGADWNEGRGGDRGPAGPEGSRKPLSDMPWHVLHNMRQERRKHKRNPHKGKH